MFESIRREEAPLSPDRWSKASINLDFKANPEE